MNTKELKKLIKETILKEFGAHHKIAGNLSVYAQPQGSNRLNVSFEDTKTADHINVSMDRKDVLAAVKALLDAANIDAKELATIGEQAKSSPITEERYSETAKRFAEEFYKRAHEQAGLPNWDSRHWQILCGLYDEFTQTHGEELTEQTFGTPGPAPVGETVEANPLDGLKKEKVKKALSKILKLDELNGKYFGDQSWTPIHKLFDTLSKVNIPYKIEREEYKKDDSGKPISKEWLVGFDFKNEKGKDTFLYLLIVAAGAGTVEDPLSRYDLVMYFTN